MKAVDIAETDRYNQSVKGAADDWGNRNDDLYGIDEEGDEAVL